MVHLFVFTLQEGDFTAKFNPKWIRKFDDMQENLTSRKAQVCDSRSPATFHYSPDGTWKNYKHFLVGYRVLELISEVSDIIYKKMLS